MMEHERDAFARYRLMRDDPRPMRKRIKQQEQTRAVKTYLDNRRLLEEFEREKFREKMRNEAPPETPELDPETATAISVARVAVALEHAGDVYEEHDGFAGADDRDDDEAKHEPIAAEPDLLHDPLSAKIHEEMAEELAEAGYDGPVAEEGEVSPNHPAHPHWHIAPVGGGYASDPPEGFGV